MAGGGAATNAGIDFQARVGALVMASMIADLDEFAALGLEGRPSVINTVRFETADGIDDLVVVAEGRSSFVQAKRSLSLSDREDSEFSSVLRQFVRQHFSAPDSDDPFVLATSPIASSKITRDLRKLTEAARLNLLGPASNPLAKTEAEVLQAAYSLIETHYLAQTGQAITTDERARLFRRIHVHLLDLESGGSLERAVLTVLAVRGASEPARAWREMIALALSLAKDRLSIDKAALTVRVGHLLTDELAAQPDAAEAALRSALDGAMPAGKDVVLATFEGRSVLAEFFRFDESGARRLRYENGQLLLPNGLQWEVIRRTATMTGMERLIAADPDIVPGEDLVLMPLNTDEDVDASPAALQHAAACRQLLADNKDLLGCLRCARPVAEELAPFIEIDEAGAASEVGLVHSACLLPTHRVIGGLAGEALAEHSLLKDFDYRTWIKAVSDGQGMFNGLSAHVRGQLAPLAWKPGRAHLSIGTWGVVYETADGEEQFMMNRGRVVTLTRAQAEEQTRIMNDALRKAAERGDPFCVVGDPQSGFGPYSVLVRSGAAGEPVEVMSAAARELSRATMHGQLRAEHYYAPLLALVEAETNELFQIGEAVVLLTDPLRLSDAVANWAAAGFDVPEFGTAIVATDDQFDSLVASCLLEGRTVVVDPKFDLKQQPASGVVIHPLEALLDADSAANEQTATETGAPDEVDWR